MVDIDYDKLREHLVDRFGSAAFSGFPAALLDLADVERAGEADLLQIAEDEGVDLGDYLA